MTGGNWTLDDIPWEAFDPAKVDPELVKIVKAASMVEYNGGDYAAYLCNVFRDDPEFQDAARAWALEEVQHGEALARWAKLADASFDFEHSFGRFRNGYQIPVEASDSVRGSRSAELVARCIVEVGTSSYYASISATTQEPVLRAICRNIAASASGSASPWRSAASARARTTNSPTPSTPPTRTRRPPTTARPAGGPT